MSNKSHSLIINSPYSMPTEHWTFTEEGKLFNKVPERRPAGYTIADPTAKPHQNRGRFIELELVNDIRVRVDEWRAGGYAGVTGITKKLLEHWQDAEEREFPFFFCQIEAIETLIWWIEGAEAEKAGLTLPNDGGAFPRLCSKLATGTGKTVVMAMLIAWQTINRATYPQDERFAKDVFIVAPNLTIQERLAVLKPSHPKSYYDEFGIVPSAMREKMNQVRVVIRNWQKLQWDTEEKIQKRKGVDKRGVKSDEAYTRAVLGELADARNLIVINDEAHHAWRVPRDGGKVKGVKREEIDEATKWIGGLDRINATRGILNCFDFSATPFAPSGNRTSEEGLFGWIVSDFGLNDAIESGLVKTPCVVVRDDALPDAKTYKSRFYHLYNDQDVKDDLNRKAEADEPLPDIVNTAYTLLGQDWIKAKERWEAGGGQTPPVMITVANRTETAARIKNAFERTTDIRVEALCDSDGILHIDSVVLKKAEEEEAEAEVAAAGSNTEDGGERKLTKKEQAERLREKVNTVGQADKPGAVVQNVISVGMLSEGWDARTVTHIMGLRAFTSQLLCEQVVGRGLRRASYELNQETGMFDPEYVNVFGVPFSFLSREEEPGETPPSPPLKTEIKPVPEKADYEISWPNVVRVEKVLTPTLSVNWDAVKTLKIDTSDIPQIAELAPTIDNKPDLSQITEIDLEELAKKVRRQTLIFQAAKAVWDDKKDQWKLSADFLIAELVRLADEFMSSSCINIVPALFNRDAKKRHIVIILSMTKVMRHFMEAIDKSNTEKRTIVFDENHPIRSTGLMYPWRTGKPHHPAEKSHINYCVFDSTWEASEAFELDRNKNVAAWVKNDHLGFEVMYVCSGVVKKYRPDFLVRMESGKMLVLEVKGQQTEQDKAKHSYMRDWIKAVNEHGGFGKWKFAVSKTPADIKDILEGVK